jgi:hypothetical protein
MFSSDPENRVRMRTRFRIQSIFERICNFSRPWFQILVRIRIRGYLVPLTNVSGSGSWSFVSDFQDANIKKNSYFLKFFRLFLVFFDGTFTSFYKDKKSQNSRNKGFSNYFCLMIKGSGSVPLTNGSGSGRPKCFRVRNTP